jgi:mRNA-degrading endonuclease RelE of RelBE toxin-antitoxin system
MAKIKIKPSAKKELIKLEDDIFIKACDCILRLRDNPYPRGFDKIQGKENQLRIWIDKKHRIIYTYEKEEDVVRIIEICKKEKDTYK